MKIHSKQGWEVSVGDIGTPLTVSEINSEEGGMKVPGLLPRSSGHFFSVGVRLTTCGYGLLQGC